MTHDPQPRTFTPKGHLRACRPTHQAARDESGAVLLLALIFMVAVALIITTLLSFAGNDLKSVSTFKSQRTTEYALGGATQVAIQSVRYLPATQSTPPLPAPPPICAGVGPSLTIDTNTVTVWCSVVWTPSSPNTRVVTFSACLTTVNGVATTPTGCATTPGLQAVVTFDDYSSSNPVATQNACIATCGTSMTVNSWIFG
jgi:hypothetical protein